MNKPIQEFSDRELLAVMRRAENVHIPGGLYQRALKKWEARQSQKGLASLAQHRNGILFKVSTEVARPAPADEPVLQEKSWYKKLSGILTVPMILAIAT